MPKLSECILSIRRGIFCVIFIVFQGQYYLSSCADLWNHGLKKEKVNSSPMIQFLCSPIRMIRPKPGESDGKGEALVSAELGRTKEAHLRWRALGCGQFLY